MVKSKLIEKYAIKNRYFSSMCGLVRVRIFDYTKGVPRQINRLCTTALLIGMADGKQILEERVIRKAVAELEQA